jgi:hypothetical protein
MRISDFKIDEATVERGEWIDNIPNFGNVRLRVRGAGNGDYRVLLTRLIAAVPSNKKIGGQLHPKENDAIMSEVLRETCLLEWEGITDDNDVPIPYSKEAALELFKERRFREGVGWAANVVAEGVAGKANGAAKNSESGSSGT